MTLLASADSRVGEATDALNDVHYTMVVCCYVEQCLYTFPDYILYLRILIRERVAFRRRGLRIYFIARLGKLLYCSRKISIEPNPSFSLYRRQGAPILIVIAEAEGVIDMRSLNKENKNLHRNNFHKLFDVMSTYPHPTLYSYTIDIQQRSRTDFNALSFGDQFHISRDPGLHRPKTAKS